MDTATDVSRTGETRRGREGSSWDVGLSFGVTCVWDRGFWAVSEGLLERLLDVDGPSDNFARAAIHASRSQSDFVFGSRSDLPLDNGMCVTKVIGPGLTGGG